MAQLATFGIPVGAIPIDMNENAVTLSSFHERAQKRFEQEKKEPFEAISKENLIFIPSNHDVLLGRNKQCQNHAGNLRYRQLIASHAQEYEDTTRAGKTVIAEAMIAIVKGYSGRFLVEHYAYFIEASDSRARQKVAHSFRTLRSKSKKKRSSAPLSEETMSTSLPSVTSVEVSNREVLEEAKRKKPKP